MQNAKKKYVFDLYLKIKIKTKLIMLDYLNCKFEKKKIPWQHQPHNNVIKTFRTP